MLVIYSIGWIITVIIGYIWLWYNEKKNPATDYSLAGFFIVSIAMFWPISIPILTIRYLYNKFKR